MNGKPYPDPSHECVGSGEPIEDAWTHQAIKRYPGATPEEIAEKVLGIAGYPDAYDQRMTRERVREIMGAPPSPTRPSGPEWIAIVRAYRRCRPNATDPLPAQEAVAEQRKISEATLRARLRDLGVDNWHDVHTLMESED